jgi:hypothetical protein
MKLARLVEGGKTVFDAGASSQRTVNTVWFISSIPYSPTLFSGLKSDHTEQKANLFSINILDI